MKILAIRFARLGDVILLLPALGSLKTAFPHAHLTLLTGHRCAPAAELCPAVDEVISVNRIAMRDGPAWNALGDLARLAHDVRRRGFDLVVDFHSFRETNLLAWLSRAPQRVGMKRAGAPYLSFCFNRPPVKEDKALHVAQMFEKVAGAAIGVGDVSDRSKEESIRIPNHLREWANQIGPQGCRLALYVDAPVPERVWPPERFAALADFAIERFGTNAAVISGTEGRHHAIRVRDASRNPSRIAVFTDLSLPQLAALIATSRLLVSNDTGPMHIGPATGVPTLGLFSVGFPDHFRPIGPRDRFLRQNPIAKIELKDVIRTAEEMWIIADPDLQR